MADLITIKGGEGNTPSLQDKELGYNRTEKALYIGTPNGNQKLCVGDDKPTLYAIYGETTGAEVNAAIQAGKLVVCRIMSGEHCGRVLQLVTDWLTGSGFTFACFDYPNAVAAEVDGSYWSEIRAYKLTQPTS